MAAPLFFTSILAKLLKDLGSTSAHAKKHAAFVGARASGEMVSGFFDGFMQRQSTLRMGQRAGHAVREMVWNAIHDTAYKYGKKTYGTRLASLLSGASTQSLVAGGNLLSLYGGSAESLNATMTSLTNKLGGLRYGDAGFLKTIMMRSNGMMNIFGSGSLGFATPHELLDNFAQIGKDLDIADFNAIADALGVDVATRKVIREGEYDLLKARVSLLNSDIDAQNKLGKQEAKTAMEWERMANLWASKTAPFWESWERWKGNLWENIALNFQQSTLENNKEDRDKFVEDKSEQIDAVLSGNSTWKKEEVAAYLPAIAQRWRETGANRDLILNIARASGVDMTNEKDLQEFFHRFIAYDKSSGLTKITSKSSSVDVVDNEEAMSLGRYYSAIERDRDEIRKDYERKKIEYDIADAEVKALEKQIKIQNDANIRPKRYNYGKISSRPLGLGGSFGYIGPPPMAPADADDTFADPVSKEEFEKIKKENIKKLQEAKEKRDKAKEKLYNRKGLSIIDGHNGLEVYDGSEQKGSTPILPPKNDKPDPNRKGGKNNPIQIIPKVSSNIPISPTLNSNVPAVAKGGIEPQFIKQNNSTVIQMPVNVAMEVNATDKTGEELVAMTGDRIGETIVESAMPHLNTISSNYSSQAAVA